MSNLKFMYWPMVRLDWLERFKLFILFTKKKKNPMQQVMLDYFILTNGIKCGLFTYLIC